MALDIIVKKLKKYLLKNVNSQNILISNAVLYHINCVVLIISCRLQTSRTNYLLEFQIELYLITIDIEKERVHFS